jgi:uncharacterized protein YkwD
MVPRDDEEHEPEEDRDDLGRVAVAASAAPGPLAAALVAIALVAGALPEAGGAARAAGPPDAAPTSEAYALRVRALVNEERARHGLPPFAKAPCAQRFAERAVAGLAQNGGLRHEPLRGLLRACEAAHGAENLATGQPTPEAVLRSWLASARHRENLLGARYTHLGVAAARAASGRWLVVADFVGFGAADGGRERRGAP